jgi:hypothetical protein
MEKLWNNPQLKLDVLEEELQEVRLIGSAFIDAFSRKCTGNLGDYAEYLRTKWEDEVRVSTIARTTLRRLIENYNVEQVYYFVPVSSLQVSVFPDYMYVIVVSNGHSVISDMCPFEDIKSRLVDRLPDARNAFLLPVGPY